MTPKIGYHTVGEDKANLAFGGEDERLRTLATIAGLHRIRIAIAG